jgi:hypothetical protein
VARSKLPSPLDRRLLVERELHAGRAMAIAEAYLGEGRALEAIEFLVKAGASDRLAALRSDAIASGDVFLLRALAGAADAPPTQEEWRQIAAAAAREGKERYAATAARQAERRED